MVPGAGLAGVRATATTLGPDGMLYIGALKSANIWRIDNPRDDPRVQTMNVIARTTDGRGVKGSIAFVGSDLYLPEARALTVIYNAPACWAFGCGPTRLDLPGVAAADSVASDGHVVYVATLPPAVAAGVRGGAGVLAPETIWRYDPATNPPAATVFETSGNLPAGLSAAAQEDCFRGTDPSTVYCRRPVDPWALRQNPTALFFVLGMYFDSGSNALYIGDDPLAGKRFGTGHIWVVK
jgi:hypothetical protein